jgi:hypothetical protein
MIVRESPVRRNFAKLLRKYNASWVFDLHSDVTEPYWIMKDGKWIRALPYTYNIKGRIPYPYGYPPTDYSDLIQHPDPIARIEYGGNVWDPDAEVSMPIRNWVGKLLHQFQIKKYGRDVLVLDAFWPMRRHERLLGFALIYARPLDVSVDLVKSLAEYLYERSQ